METPMSVSDTGQRLHWDGAVLHVPHGICLATVFNWLRHRNEAPNFPPVEIKENEETKF